MARRPLPWEAVGLLLAVFPAFAQHSIDYLYIEANSGTSSGGHVAVKLDETVYHFQNKDGLILLQRDGWDRFRHLYADLDNRDIHLARVAIPDQDQEEIRRHLDLYHLTQKAFINQRDALERDVQLIEALTLRESIDVPGAGFFVDRVFNDTEGLTLSGESGTRPYLEGLLWELLLKRKDLHYSPPREANKEFDQTTFGRGFADEWMDLLQGEIAIKALLSRKVLNTSIMLDGGPLPPTGAQTECSAREWLTRYRDRMEQDALRLLRNPYPGSGLPLLRTLARLEVVRLSLKKERLLFLSPAMTSSSKSRGTDHYLETPQAHLEQEFRRHLDQLGQQVFCSAEIDDLAYHKLELASLDLHEAAEANRLRVSVQFDHDPDLPNAPAPLEARQLTGDWLPTEQQLTAAQNAQSHLEDRVLESMRYNVILRNCVTELIRAMYKGFENDQEPDSYGGHIDPLRSQAFAPFRFFELVLARYPVTHTQKILSFRHKRLAELQARNEDLWLDLKESNTLTGTIYKPREEDGIFLFFTDDTFWSRPVLGAANLGVAIGTMTLGLAGLPFDSGQLFWSGARGVLFSLPEIAMWNIRKGTFTETTLR